MKLKSGHLTYCTNIHPGKNWAEDFAALRENFPEIKKAVAPGEALGLGLRLSNEASLTLTEPGQLEIFKDWLAENNAYVYTMNGFPYGEFHRRVVKDDVHAPDWTTHERREYTLRLFRILESLLPEGMDGGISTSPLSYRHWHQTTEAAAEARKLSTQHIIEVIAALAATYERSGKLMHLDIEPEPDGVLETGREFIDWFEHDLLPAGVPYLQHDFDITAEEAEAIIRRHLCLCYDVCHFAIGYENHEAVLRELAAKKIVVGKIQISAALKARLDRSVSEKQLLKTAIEAFNEPTYLHQVVARLENGELIRYKDLPDALAEFDNTEAVEWRAHFHVPISTLEIDLIHTTQNDIKTVLSWQKSDPFTQHLEVETYTWEVLPEQIKTPIAQSISNELKWVINELS
ncbi:metabolite traffic protein EboE [Pedobacter faecalis]|uniref:metabolite traffic protein EboE n=1 Tax=Pedobacter faecalis TaxID=3041495 RepID=UPI00254C0C27|nr:metabolite traffic protein EboE [Pedobacter sp. ELA7]